MKKILAIVCSSFLGFSAFAYKDGTYTCKNRNQKLPDNIYKIQTLNLGGASVPFIDATLYYFSKPGDDTSPIVDSKLKGVAFVSSSSSKSVEVLQVAALSLSFDGDTFLNCRP